MTIEQFLQSLHGEKPPSGMNSLLLALWHDGKGDWENSHDVVGDLETKEAARIHAYLHRKEGDIGNADYWYNRAKEKRPEITLEEEYDLLIRRFLESTR